MAAEFVMSIAEHHGWGVLIMATALPTPVPPVRRDAEGALQRPSTTLGRGPPPRGRERGGPEVGAGVAAAAARPGAVVLPVVEASPEYQERLLLKWMEEKRTFRRSAKSTSTRRICR